MKNERLIKKLLQLKLNWWNRFCKYLTKIFKTKSVDFSYQEYLDAIKKSVIIKNNEEDSEDFAYQVYLDNVREYLKINKKRLLTKQEEEIVFVHLYTTALTFCNEHSKKRNDADNSCVPDITQVLSIEAIKKVSEIHPDIPTPVERRNESNTKR